MGEIAESMLDGSFCEQCGEYLGEAVGFPQCCSGCGGDAERESSKASRAANRESSNLLLRERGYQFEEKNGAAHLIVRTERGVVDFWPGTGKFVFRQDGYEARGVFNLMNHAAPAPDTESNSSIEIIWAPHMTSFAIRTYVAAGFTVIGAPTEAT